jgi:hypothetical protein
MRQILEWEWSWGKLKLELWSLVFGLWSLVFGLWSLDKAYFLVCDESRKKLRVNHRKNFKDLSPKPKDQTKDLLRGLPH